MDYALVALLCLAAAAIPQPESRIVCPSTPEHPRNGEADIIQLKNGDLLLAYGRWNRSTDDFGRAEVWCKTSHDGGKTWGEDRVLIPNEGKLTTFSVSFLRLANGEILMSYLYKDSQEDCNVCFRKSADEGKTWGPRFRFDMPAGYSGYTGINNDRLVQLKSGRILAACWEGWVKGRIILGFTLYSDDNGATWHKGADVDMRDYDPATKRGAMEPAVIELKDGRVMMIIRTDLGIIGRCYSTDGGVTWSKPEAVKGLVAPVAPASIARIPQTGDLLLIWNNSKTERTPLCSAISKDEGETWTNIRTLETGRGFAYTSITPVGDRIILTYWQYEPEGLSLKLTRVDYRWFYGE